MIDQDGIYVRTELLTMYFVFFVYLVNYII